MKIWWVHSRQKENNVSIILFVCRIYSLFLAREIERSESRLIFKEGWKTIKTHIPCDCLELIVRVAVE